MNIGTADVIIISWRVYFYD